MTKKFFGTKTLFKEAQLEAKNVKNFLRVRNPRNRIFHASAVVYLISRPENCAALRLKF